MMWTTKVVATSLCVLVEDGRLLTNDSNSVLKKDNSTSQTDSTFVVASTTIRRWRMLTIPLYVNYIVTKDTYMIKRH